MNKKTIFIALGVAVAGVGGYFLYKTIKDHRDCLAYTKKHHWYDIEMVKDFCKLKNWKEIASQPEPLPL